MTTQTLTQPNPLSAGAQPASGGFELAMQAAACAPRLDLNKVLAPRTAPDKFADRPHRGDGSLVRAQEFACKEYPNDVCRQIMYLFEHELVAATGRLRVLGFARRAAMRETMLKFVKVLNECADQLKDPSLRLRNISEFGPQHLLAILRWFAKNKTKRSTIHNKLSVLRKFMTQLGRRYLVPCTDELAHLVIEHHIELDFGGRSYTAYVAAAWSAIVDVERVLQVIKDKDMHAYLLCELCLLFGLRLSEVLRLRPFESDWGDCLAVLEGAKGGRQRSIPFSADPERRAQQRAVLEKAKAACGGNPRRYLGFGDRTLEQARKHFQTILEECGVTQTKAGIKLHGLRHEYAVRRFYELTGLPAPVLRQAPLSAYAERMALVRQAREQISRELGHGRPNVTSAYIGSLPTLREEARQTEKAAQTVAQHCAELEKMGVVAVSVAVRKVAARQHTCTLYIQPADAGHVAAHDNLLVARVCGSTRAWLRRKITVLLGPAPAQAGIVTISVKR